MNNRNKAKLLNSIPPERYKLLSDKGKAPEKGDIIELDQGYTGSNGEPMCIAYAVSESGVFLCEMEVYESELSS